MSSIDLQRNAFAVLDVGIRANAGQVSEAHDDRLFDGGDEASLDLARSRLTVARDRIEEEITYLPELAPNRAREVLRSIPSVSTYDQAVAVFSSLPNLSKANVIADLIGRVGDQAPLVPALAEAHAVLDMTSARDDLERARAASGIGAITDAVWQRALTHLRERHAGVLSGTLTKISDGPARLTKVLEDVRGTEPTDWYRGILDETVDRYDRWSQPRLGVIEEQLDQAIADVRTAPGSRGKLAPVVQALEDWDVLSQPVQLRDEAKGLDEPRSRRVCEKVRDLAIWLANEHSQHEAALELSRALQTTFPELPGVIHQISGDIETLGELIKKSRAHSLMEPLASLAEQAEQHLSAVGSDIRNGHFSPSGEGFAGKLYEEFQSACVRSDQLPDPALPWFLIRSIAIALNNDADDPAAASTLVDAVIETAPEPARSRLKEDQSTLLSRVRYKELNDAIARDDLGEVRRLISVLLPNADADERAGLEKLKAGIARRQAGQVMGWVRWGIFGVVLFVGALSQCGKESSSYSSHEYSADTGHSVDDTMTTNEVLANDASVAADDEAEEPPPEYTSSALTIPQLRYCVFEEQRLTYLERIVPSAAYADFNARIDEYNNRCRGKSYSDADRGRIDLEAAARREGLESEARSILDQWLPAPPIVTPQNTDVLPSRELAPSENESEVPGSSQNELDTIFGNRSGE